MQQVLCPALINAADEEIGCGDFAFDSLKIGDQVKLLQPIAPVANRPENRIAIWVRVTEINRHPLADRQLLTGTVEEVLDLGESDLEKGQSIRFARCNIVEVA